MTQYLNIDMVVESSYGVFDGTQDIDFVLKYKILPSETSEFYTINYKITTTGGKTTASLENYDFHGTNSPYFILGDFYGISFYTTTADPFKFLLNETDAVPDDDFINFTFSLSVRNDSGDIIHYSPAYYYGGTIIRSDDSSKKVEFYVEEHAIQFEVKAEEPSLECPDLSGSISKTKLALLDSYKVKNICKILD